MGAASAIPVSVSNLTPTFWSVVVLTVIVIGAVIKVWPLLDKQKRDGDASLRADLLKMLTEERESHAKEMAALRQEMADERRRCDDEMRTLRGQVEGLQRMIVQFQVSSGHPIKFTPEADKSVGRVAGHLANKEDGE